MAYPRIELRQPHPPAPLGRPRADHPGPRRPRDRAGRVRRRPRPLGQRQVDAARPDGRPRPAHRPARCRIDGTPDPRDVGGRARPAAAAQDRLRLPDLPAPGQPDGARERAAAARAPRSCPRPAAAPTSCSPPWASPSAATTIPSQLSGGEQQRVALARAFAARPADPARRRAHRQPRRRHRPHGARDPHRPAAPRRHDAGAGHPRPGGGGAGRPPRSTCATAASSASRSWPPPSPSKQVGSTGMTRFPLRRAVLRESRGARGRLGFFVACLAVGVAAVVAVAGLSGEPRRRHPRARPGSSSPPTSRSRGAGRSPRGRAGDRQSPGRPAHRRQGDGHRRRRPEHRGPAGAAAARRAQGDRRRVPVLRQARPPSPGAPSPSCSTRRPSSPRPSCSPGSGLGVGDELRDRRRALPHRRRGARRARPHQLLADPRAAGLHVGRGPGAHRPRDARQPHRLPHPDQAPGRHQHGPASAAAAERLQRRAARARGLRTSRPTRRPSRPCARAWSASTASSGSSPSSRCSSAASASPRACAPGSPAGSTRSPS